MPTKEQRAAKIERIGSCPRALHDAVNGLSDEQLDTPYRDGGWTCRQVVHHVADSHMNAFARFKWVITEDHPTIKTYDQDLWANLPDMKMPLAPSFSIIDGLHARWTRFLSSLPDDAWSRKANHPEHGEITLDDLLDIYAEHGHNHAKQITDLRARKGW
jgi:uncharacterized damage-inducible protein DinB